MCLDYINAESGSLMTVNSLLLPLSIMYVY